VAAVVLLGLGVALIFRSATPPPPIAAPLPPIEAPAMKMPEKK
jgi:hypothetical protein